VDWLNFHHLRYSWVVAREGSVSRAARHLRLAQPTVSEQIHALEQALGERLLVRAGRGVALTEVGKTVYAFADEIFTLGRDLQDTIRGRPTGRPSRLGVGIADAVPKLVAFRILEPVLGMDPPVRLVCLEDSPERLLDRLSTHDLDVVAELPFLLPTTDTALRRSLDAWLDERGILPNVIAELEDSALIVEFGALGAGLFAAPDAIMEDALAARGLQRVGSIDELRERYYAISIERKLAHPAVVAIAGAARRRWYADERDRE
jgi:LysR family transcriptional activator of nhaA